MHTPYSFYLSRVESEPNSDFNALSDLNKTLIIPNTLVFTYLPQNIQAQSQISPFSTSFGKRAVTTATVAKQISHVTCILDNYTPPSMCEWGVKSCSISIKRTLGTNYQNSGSLKHLVNQLVGSGQMWRYYGNR